MSVIMVLRSDEHAVYRTVYLDVSNVPLADVHNLCEWYGCELDVEKGIKLIEIEIRR